MTENEAVIYFGGSGVQRDNNASLCLVWVGGGGGGQAVAEGGGEKGQGGGGGKGTHQSKRKY